MGNNKRPPGDHLRLIDVSLEDDSLLPFSAGGEESVVSNVENPRLLPSEEPAFLSRKKRSAPPFNLRKSLAWNDAFFTDEGVLDPEELSLVSKAFRKNTRTFELQFESKPVEIEMADRPASPYSGVCMVTDDKQQMNAGVASRTAIIPISNSGSIPKMRQHDESSGEPCLQIPAEHLVPNHLLSGHAKKSGDKVPKTAGKRNKNTITATGLPTSLPIPKMKASTSVKDRAVQRFEKPACAASQDHVPGTCNSSYESTAMSSKKISLEMAAGRLSSSLGFRDDSMRVQKSLPMVSSSKMCVKGTGLINCNPPSSVKPSGLRKPSPKLGFFDPGRSGSEPQISSFPERLAEEGKVEKQAVELAPAACLNSRGNNNQAVRASYQAPAMSILSLGGTPPTSSSHIPRAPHLRRPVKPPRTSSTSTSFGQGCGLPRGSASEKRPYSGDEKKAQGSCSPTLIPSAKRPFTNVLATVAHASQLKEAASSVGHPTSPCWDDSSARAGRPLTALNACGGPQRGVRLSDPLLRRETSAVPSTARSRASCPAGLSASGCDFTGNSLHRIPLGSNGGNIMRNQISSKDGCPWICQNSCPTIINTTPATATAARGQGSFLLHSYSQRKSDGKSLDLIALSHVSPLSDA